jgi:uracil-DNA glycosylase
MPNQVNPQIPRRINWNGIIIVGEAPGAEEDKQQKVFVGRSGKLLNSMLREAGIRRKQCVVANIFRTRPPANQVSHFFLPRQQWKTVKPEFKKDLRALYKLLDEFRPAILIALGHTAGWFTTKYTGSLVYRVGKLIPMDYGIVMQLWHPSYFLHGQQDKIPLQVKHLKFAKRLAQRLIR